MGYKLSQWSHCGRMLLLFVTALIIAMPRRSVGAQADSSGTRAPKTGPPDPTLAQRPPAGLKSLTIPEGKIKLDVMVRDEAGKPITDLQPWDFKILDNDQGRKVMSFRVYGAAVMPDPPVEVLLVLDTLNLPFQQVAFVRQQIEDFLHQDGGRLKQPVSVILLTDAGIRVQPRPSTDGNAIASVVAGIKGGVSTINPAMGGEGYVERFQRSAHALDNIAQNERKKPGRKLLIWVGPGWPMLNRPSDGYTEVQKKRNFDGIVELQTALREARITVYSVAPAGAPGSNSILYRNFLKPVKSWQDAEAADLALRVLVTQTGGEILGPDNDLVSQINRCIEDANAFYRIGFDPPEAGHPDELHELKISVNRPGAVVRTTTEYYNLAADR